jgi:SAM-dependent methyltransferase
MTDSRGIKTMGKVAQVTTFAGTAAAAAWRTSTAVRTAYMARTTELLLDMARVGPGSRVLVVGAGAGGEALDAAIRVGPTGHVEATDLSPAMIDAAQEAAAEAGVTNVEFSVMDAQRLEFPNATFDAVISRNVLVFIPDLAVGLAEMKRVLKPSGRVGATVWSSRARNPRIAGPLAAARALGGQPPESATYRIALRLSTPASLRHVFGIAGFHELDVQRVTLMAHYVDLDDAVSRAMEQPGTRELLRILGYQPQERMQRSLERRWARYADPSGTHLPGEQLVASATP